MTATSPLLAPELQSRLDQDSHITYSNEQWQAAINKTAEKLQVTDKQYPVPAVSIPDFAKTIDHTLLKLDSTPEQFKQLCVEAKKDRFATVCVRPPQVAQCIAHLNGTDVKVASVIGFHEGDYDLDHKLRETRQSVDAGAQELDLVINYHQLKAGNYAFVYRELAAVRLQAPTPTLIKLIIETSQLGRAEIIAACTLAGAADLDYVKTSTGFSGPGATEDNVRLMAALCETLKGKKQMKVKASGGVRSLGDAMKMLGAGASRLGTSSGVKIAQECQEAIASGKTPTPTTTTTTTSGSAY